LDPMNPIPIP